MHAEVFSIGIFRGPVPGGGLEFAAADGAVGYEGAGEEAALLHGGGVDERLEGGSHLALGEEGAVVLAIAEVAATYDGNDRTGVVVDGDEGSLKIGGVALGFVVVCFGGVLVAGSFFDVGETAFDGSFGYGLELGIDGGVDLKPTDVEIGIVEDAVEIAADGVERPGRFAGARGVCPGLDDDLF